MNLKYYIKDNKKIYTIKGNIEGKQTQDAHYKFIKFKDASEHDNR